MGNLTIGIDLGGTNLRAALVDKDGKIASRLEEHLTDDKSPDAIVSAISAMVNILREKLPRSADMKSIGVGAPGGIDVAQGIVTQSPHLPLWKDVPLKKLLSEFTRLPVAVDNDANCFALGESRFGNGRGVENFLALTIGTGIGGAIILHQELWHGDSGMAGEFGHMMMDFNGPPCACGSRGCLEVYASGSALARMAREIIDKGRPSMLKEEPALNGEVIERAAEQGDVLARELLGRLGKALGLGIANLVNMTGITQVIVGGKVIRSWDYFFPSLQESLKRQCFRRVAEQVKVIPARLGDDAGLLGAAVL